MRKIFEIRVSTMFMGFLVAQMVKRLPAMWETWVRSLGWDDPLEKEMATHSSILAWRIPWMEKAMAPHSSTLAWKILWTEEPGRLQSMGSPESDTTERLHFHFLSPCL